MALLFIKLSYFNKNHNYYQLSLLLHFYQYWTSLLSFFTSEHPSYLFYQWSSLLTGFISEHLFLPFFTSDPPFLPVLSVNIPSYLFFTSDHPFLPVLSVNIPSYLFYQWTSLFTCFPQLNSLWNAFTMPRSVVGPDWLIHR